MLRMLTLLLLLILSGCAKGPSHIIADIPEASGICYHTASGSLYVVGDEGMLYRLSTDGKILKKKHLGNYDLEGIACSSGKLYLAVEGSDNILIVNPHTMTIRKEIDIRRKFNGKTVLKKDKKRGIEGITIADGTLFLTNQSEKKYPAKDPSILFSIQPPDKEKVAITQIYDIGYPDLAGLDYHDGLFYLVSDTKDLLILFDPKHQKVTRTFKLPKVAQEGVALDDRGNLYFADDNGHIMKFRQKDLK